MKNIGTIGALLYIAVVGLFFIGWIKSIVHLCDCDFKESYKAEVIYAVGTFIPPVGGVVGYMDFGN